MKIFLDSSVILSACGSTKSLSRLITEIAEDRGWNLVSAVYCRAETVKNLAKFEPQVTAHWQNLETRIEWVPNALTTKRPYKEAWPLDLAVKYLQDDAGKAFDPNLIDAFINNLPEMIAIKDKYAEPE